MSDKFDTDRWCTPRELLEPVEALWPQPKPIGLDPCWDPDGLVDPLVKFDIRDGKDALQLPWIKSIEAEASNPNAPRMSVLSAFYNCPYSMPGKFVAKASVEAFISQGAEIVGLVPPATGSKWWATHVWRHARAICLIRGRRNFMKQGKVVSGNRYDSSFVLHASNDQADSAIERFRATMSELGTVFARGRAWSQL